MNVRVFFFTQIQTDEEAVNGRQGVGMKLFGRSYWELLLRYKKLWIFSRRSINFKNILRGWRTHTRNFPIVNNLIWLCDIKNMCNGFWDMAISFNVSSNKVWQLVFNHGIFMTTFWKKIAESPKKHILCLLSKRHNVFKCICVFHTQCVIYSICKL